MAKKSTRTARQHHQDLQAIEQAPVVTYTPPPARGPIEPKTERQRKYLAAIKSSTITFGLGPAGTGKTFCAASYAAELLVNRQVERVILTRPAVEAGVPMGFLPGTIEEKYEPFLQPFRDTMVKRMGRGPFEYALKAGKILPQPLAYMRGATFDDAVVLLDEAQNVTKPEMLMFLTRIGQNCKVVVSGDVAQCDLNGPSGLGDAVMRLQHVPGVRVIEFDEDDIVRSGIVKDIIKAYRD